MKTFVIMVPQDNSKANPYDGRTFKSAIRKPDILARSEKEAIVKAKKLYGKNVIVIPEYKP